MSHTFTELIDEEERIRDVCFCTQFLRLTDISCWGNNMRRRLLYSIFSELYVIPESFVNGLFVNGLLQKVIPE